MQNYIKSSERTNKKEVNAAEWLINERFVLPWVDVFIKRDGSLSGNTYEPSHKKLKCY